MQKIRRENSSREFLLAATHASSSPTNMAFFRKFKLPQLASKGKLEIILMQKSFASIATNYQLKRESGKELMAMFIRPSTDCREIPQRQQLLSIVVVSCSLCFRGVCFRGLCFRGLRSEVCVFEVCVFEVCVFETPDYSHYIISFDSAARQIQPIYTS